MLDILRWLTRDPRHYQIAMLSALLTYGIVALDFEIRASQAITVVIAALASQWIATRVAGLPRFDPKSAMISALSLCILLRTNHLVLAAVVAGVSILSKFVLRFDGRHVWNPTNLGLVVGMLLTPGVWVSPGQWGSVAFLAFLFACLGGLVVNRAARSDVTYAFLGFHALIGFGRAFVLGDPWTIPLHGLQSGSFLLFTFFMISDPKATPSSRAGRIVFAGLVATAGAIGRYTFFEPNALLYALALLAPVTLLLDRVLPGARYQWTQTPGGPRPVLDPKGAPHAISNPASRAPHGASRPRVPGLDASHRARHRLLRILRGPGRRRPLERGVAGGARPRR